MSYFLLERELFDALNHEEYDQAYEELEDDFINQANKGMPCLIPIEKKEISTVKQDKDKDNKIKDQVTKEKKEKIMEIPMEKEQPKLEFKKDKKGPDVEEVEVDRKIAITSKKEFIKVLNEHIDEMRKNYIQKQKDKELKNPTKKGKSFAEEEEDEEDEDLEDEELEENPDNIIVPLEDILKDKIPYEEDVAMQNLMERESQSDSEIDFEKEFADVIY